MDALVVILAALGSVVWQAVPTVPTVPGPLAFSVDVAELIALGGLVWRMAEMSAAVKTMAKAIDRLTEAETESEQFRSDMKTRVSVLEDRDSNRRDRRHDDA